METEIKLNENLVLIYVDGLLYVIANPIDDVKVYIQKSGTRRWYKHGQLHKDNDLPAIIFADGIKIWYKDGEIHRDNGPAVIWPNGSCAWYKNGKHIKTMQNGEYFY